MWLESTNVPYPKRGFYSDSMCVCVSIQGGFGRDGRISGTASFKGW